jgi:predicted RNase H-like nuclease (RuvC/YqgF family)
MVKDIEAFKLEEKERSLQTIEEVKFLREEIIELKSKINEMSLLIYSLELKLSEIEQKVTNDLTEVKLLMVSGARPSPSETS